MERPDPLERTERTERSGLQAVPDRDRVAELVSSMARALSAEELIGGVTEIIVQGIPDLDGDEVMQHLLGESVRGNVLAILDMLATAREVSTIAPTPGAVAYALRLAQRGVPGNALVRAYTLGKDWFVQQLIRDVQQLGCSTGEQFAVVQAMSIGVGEYIDSISQQVYEVYEKERDRWLRAEGTVRAAAIHDLITHQRVDGFGAATGYRLTGSHLALLLWTTREAPGPEDQRVLGHVVTRVAQVLGATGTPLVTTVDAGTAWAWLPMDPARGDVEIGELERALELHDHCRVAIGMVGRGADGFRLSHLQAVAARRVLAQSAAGAAPVVGYGEEGVAVTSMLSTDLAATRSWVAGVLGPLALDTAQAATLRDTLRVFHACGESATETAERMTLHRNTVRYRLGRAGELMAERPTVSRTDLAMALLVCHHLGSAVLLQDPT